MWTDDYAQLCRGAWISIVLTKRIRQLISVFRDSELEDALAMMRRSGVHLARSFDETGEISGVLFLEDIIEVLVGEVRDATRRI